MDPKRDPHTTPTPTSTPQPAPLTSEALDRSDHRPVATIDIDSITIGEQLIRTDPDNDSIHELAYDLAVRGQLQPIGVTSTGPGTYQLLYGHRRILALRRLGRTTVRATIHDERHHDIKGTALAENLHRRQLSLSEECDAVANMHFHMCKSPDQIAALTGKSRQWVLKRLAIPHYPDDIRVALIEERLTLGQADALANIGDQAARSYIMSQAQQHRIGPTQIKEMAAAWSSAGGIADAVAAAEEHVTSAPATIRHIVKCLACGSNRPAEQTILIRVCSDGCSTTTSPNETPKHDA